MILVEYKYIYDGYSYTFHRIISNRIMNITVNGVSLYIIHKRSSLLNTCLLYTSRRGGKKVLNKYRWNFNNCSGCFYLSWNSTIITLIKHNYISLYESSWQDRELLFIRRWQLHLSWIIFRYGSYGWSNFTYSLS